MKAFLLFLVISFVSNITAFKCYQCEYYEGDNSTQSGCNKEPVPEEYLLECKYPTTVPPGQKVTQWQCAKKIGKITNDNDEENKYVGRYCSAGRTFDNKCKESDALATRYGTIEKGFLCYCGTEETDGCNGATNLHEGIFAIIASVCLLAFRNTY